MRSSFEEDESWPKRTMNRFKLLIFWVHVRSVLVSLRFSFSRHTMHVLSAILTSPIRPSSPVHPSLRPSDNLLVHAGPGRKRVVLFAPSDAPCLYVASSSSAVVDIDAPDLQRFPRFAHTRPFEVYISRINRLCLSFSKNTVLKSRQ